MHKAQREIREIIHKIDVFISNYIENMKTKEYHYVLSVQTTMQHMLPLKKRMETIRTMDTLKKMKRSEMI